MIDHSYALKRLNYDPGTGIFKWRPWKTGIWDKQWADKQAGHRDANKGYVRIAMVDENGHRYSFLAHRLAWFYVHGVWPEEQLDHIDGNRSNNAISNLRPASQSLNNANMKLRRDNSFRLKGVTRNGVNYSAKISINRKRYHLGTFRTPEEAHAAYCGAAEILFGEFARRR